MTMLAEMRLGVAGCLRCGGFVEGGRWQFEPTCINCAKVYYNPTGALIVMEAVAVAKVMQERPVRPPPPPGLVVVEQPVLPRVTAMLMKFAKGPMTNELKDDRLFPESPKFDEAVFKVFSEKLHASIAAILEECMDDWPNETFEALGPKPRRGEELLSDIMWDTAHDMVWELAE